MLRTRSLAGAQAPLVVAGAAHADMVQAQLAALAVEAVVLIEPEGRDSGPAIAAAATWIASRDPDGLAVSLASDHHIPDAQAFCAAVATAAPAAAGGWVVSFGVAPTAPVTAYGYIHPGAELPEAPGVRRVRRFVEKPDAATAQAYLRDGYLWNSGNLVFSPSALLADLAVHAPEVLAQTARALDEAGADGPLIRLGPSFSRAPRISIDHALMEKTDRAAVAPVAFAWSDLGAWDAVLAASERDAAGNAVVGEALLVDCRDSLVRNASPAKVAAVGLRNVGVVVEDDAILVCALDASQAVGVVAGGDFAHARPPPSPTAHSSLKAAAAELKRWQWTGALPLWWALGADHEQGGFHERLDMAGSAIPTPQRARVQARQAYVYAVAGAAGWPGPWRVAVEHGLAFLAARHRRADGLYRATPDAGEEHQTPAFLYDQAFVMFAFAKAAQVLPERSEALEREALDTLTALHAVRAHPAGGFREGGGATLFQSNPHMHLLEAALAWSEAGSDPAWAVLADEIVALCRRAFIDPDSGALREFFDSDWRPAPGEAGRVVEPGHQFEWAWLLERWGRHRGETPARIEAVRLFEIGRRGVDARGVAVDALGDDLSILRPTARLWPQSEHLKASLALAEGTPDPAQGRAYRACALQAVQALGRYLEVPTLGLWRDRLLPEGGFVEEPVLASSFYHLACAIEELVARTKAE